MKIIIILSLISLQLHARTFRKHETCVYNQSAVVNSTQLPKAGLQLAQRRAQEKCQGYTTTNKYPNNGISLCSYYAKEAIAGRYKGRKIVCVNHACPGSSKVMDKSCKEFAQKPAIVRRTTVTRRTTPTRKFIVNPNKTYKTISKCYYGKKGHVNTSLRALSKEELIVKGKLVRRMGQEMCLPLHTLKRSPTTGVHSCSFYSQIATKGRYKGQRVICLDYSCTSSSYTMDDTCLNFKLR